MRRRTEERRRQQEEEERLKREVEDMERLRRREEEELVRRRRELAQVTSPVRPRGPAPPVPSPLRGGGGGYTGDTIDAQSPAVGLASTMSLSEVYRHHCRDHGIKPNSGVLRMLPKDEGAHVRELNLGLNYIGVKGIQPLLEVLRQNSGLQKLNLRDNNLENNEIRSLVQVLLSRAGESLTALDISNNPVSLAGGSAIVDLLSRQRQLTDLEIQGTLIQPKILERIEDQLRQNRMLQAP